MTLAAIMLPCWWVPWCQGKTLCIWPLSRQPRHLESNRASKNQSVCFEREESSCSSLGLGRKTGNWTPGIYKGSKYRQGSSLPPYGKTPAGVINRPLKAQPLGLASLQPQLSHEPATSDWGVLKHTTLSCQGCPPGAAEPPPHSMAGG